MYPYAACTLRKVPYVSMVILQKNNTDTKCLRVCCSQSGIYSPISQCVVNRTAHLKDRELIHLHRSGPYQRSIARSLWILIHKSEILSQKPKPLFSERQSLGWWDAQQVRCLLHMPDDLSLIRTHLKAEYRTRSTKLPLSWTHAP